MLSNDLSEIVKKESLEMAAEGKTKSRWSVCTSQDSAKRNRDQRGIGSSYDLTGAEEHRTILKKQFSEPRTSAGACTCTSASSSFPSSKVPGLVFAFV